MVPTTSLPLRRPPGGTGSHLPPMGTCAPLPAILQIHRRKRASLTWFSPPAFFRRGGLPTVELERSVSTTGGATWREFSQCAACLPHLQAGMRGCPVSVRSQQPHDEPP